MTVTSDVLKQLPAGKLFIRQTPGPKNALGLVKCIFPNDFNVYMHDTPAREFFSKSRTRPPNPKRNQFRGPASVNLDLRTQKDFRFGERYKVGVLVEFFNLTNQANPTQCTTNLFN